MWSDELTDGQADNRHSYTPFMPSLLRKHLLTSFLSYAPSAMIKTFDIRFGIYLTKHVHV